MSTSITSDLDQRQRLREARVTGGDAQIDAAAALAQANAAVVLAGGMLILSYSPASGTGVADGAMWRQIDVSGQIVGEWSWEAAVGAWNATKISPTLIASAIIGDLAAGKIDTSLVTIRSPGSTTYGILDGTGLRAYAAGVKTADINFTTGDVMFTGTYRNAPVGSDRLEINAYGVDGWGSQVGFVSAAGAAGYGAIFGGTQVQIRPLALRTTVGTATVAGNYATSALGTLNLYGNIGGAGSAYLAGSSGGGGQVFVGAVGGTETVNLLGVVNVNGLRLKVPQSGSATVTVTSSVTGFIDVTFPTAFASAPNVVTTPAASTTYIAVVSAISATGFRITVRHVDGTSASASVAVQWIAVAPI